LFFLSFAIAPFIIIISFLPLLFILPAIYLPTASFSFVIRQQV
jgi:hypothetical protein